MREKKSKRNILAVVSAVAALAAIALWQFYVFVTFKTEGVVDIQGGAMHLWLAIGLGLTACIGALVGASFFLRYDRNGEMHITSPPQRREPVL